MTDFSIKEAETLCLKASRGAGYTWGVAEEAGFAAGWLAKRGVSDFSEIAQHLIGVEEKTHAQISPGDTNGFWSAASGPLCPITTGTYLSDNCRQFDWDEGIKTADLSCPLFILPFVSNASKTLGFALLVDAGDFKAIIAGEALQILAGADALNIAGASKVTIIKSSREIVADSQSCARVNLSDNTLAILNRFAAKTYVPESDELRESGAGGENVDKD